MRPFDVFPALERDKLLAKELVAHALAIWLLRSRPSGLFPVFDWKLAARTFTRVHWHWVAISLIPICGTYWGRALRWSVFLQPLKPHPSMRNLLSATVVTYHN